jgi:phosphate-selective porin OprO and OprP
MRRSVMAVFILLIVLLNTVFAQDSTKSVPLPEFKAFWDNGLKFETADKAFRFELGGRLDMDWGWMSADDEIKDIGAKSDGTEFRRARINLQGSFYEHLIFRTEYDFIGGEAQYRDVFVGVKGIPVIGTVKVGHFNEPFGFDEIASTNDNILIEKAAASLFTPKRNSGLSISNSILKNQMTWAIGVFKETDDYAYSSSDGGTNVTARVTGLPWHPSKDRLLHLGFSFSTKNPSAGIKFSSRPDYHLAGNFIDTGTLDAETVNLLNGECAVLVGPVWIQSEISNAMLDLKDTGNVSFSSFYVQGSWFLTGETRKYNEATGVFGGVKPANNLMDKNNGMGAWELILRYSNSNLNDGAIRGGELSDITLGVNWYLASNAKVMINYIHPELADVTKNGMDVDEGSADIVVVRFHIDF